MRSQPLNLKFDTMQREFIFRFRLHVIEYTPTPSLKQKSKLFKNAVIFEVHKLGCLFGFYNRYFIEIVVLKEHSVVSHH